MLRVLGIAAVCFLFLIVFAFMAYQQQQIAVLAARQQQMMTEQAKAAQPTPNPPAMATFRNGRPIPIMMLREAIRSAPSRSTPISPARRHDPILPPQIGMLWSPTRGWCFMTPAQQEREEWYTQPPWYSMEQIQAAYNARYSRRR